MLELELLPTELTEPVAMALELAAHAGVVFLVADDRDLALVDLGAQAIERLADLLELGLGGDQPGHRLVEVVLEPPDDLVEIADLALLGEHAGALRLARAARHHAVLVDDIAIKRDDAVAHAAHVQIEGARQLVDDDRAT